MRCVLLTAFSIALLSPGIASAETYTPEDDILEIIKVAIADQMRDPESTRIDDVVARDKPLSDGQVATYVCGTYQGRNGYGGYAQPHPFYGFLGTNSKTGEKSFLPITLAQTDNEAIVAQMMCQKDVFGQ